MTHDELLGKINEQIRSNPMGVFFPYLLAVRAVVELHKPQEIKDSMIYCEGCSNSAFFPWDSCQTIRAIEKGLAK